MTSRAMRSRMRFTEFLRFVFTSVKVVHTPGLEIGNLSTAGLRYCRALPETCDRSVEWDEPMN